MGNHFSLQDKYFFELIGRFLVCLSAKSDIDQVVLTTKCELYIHIR